MKDVGEINVSQDIDRLSAPALAKEIMAYLEKGITNIILDLSDVRLISSHGMAIILVGMRKVFDQNGKLVLVANHPRMYDLLKVANIHKLAPIYTTREQALESFAKD